MHLYFSPVILLSFSIVSVLSTYKWIIFHCLNVSLSTLLMQKSFSFYPKYDCMIKLKKSHLFILENNIAWKLVICPNVKIGLRLLITQSLFLVSVILNNHVILVLPFKFTEQSAVKNSTPQLPCQYLIPLWLHSVHWVERRKYVATMTGLGFLYTYSSLVAPLKIMRSSLELDREAWNCMKTMIYLYQRFLK